MVEGIQPGFAGKVVVEARKTYRAPVRVVRKEVYNTDVGATDGDVCCIVLGYEEKSLHNGRIRYD